MSQNALDLLVPHLTQIEGWTAILLDTARAAEHEDAADSILRALCHGARSFETVFPLVALSSFESISFDSLPDRQRLSIFGHILAESLRERGRDWPPADADPPGVVVALLAIYDRFHSYRHLGVDLSALRTNVRDLRETSCGLVRSGTREEKIAAARRAGGSTHNAAFRFLSGTALLIGLLQGPGAVLDAYPDSAELAHVLSIHVRVLTREVYGTVASLVGPDASAPSPFPVPGPSPQPGPQPAPIPVSTEFVRPSPTKVNSEFARPSPTTVNSEFAHPDPATTNLAEFADPRMDARAHARKAGPDAGPSAGT